MEHRIDIDGKLRKYCEDWSTKENNALETIESFTHLNMVKRHDASDKIQGRLISFISHLIRPSLVVEIGTFTAYATGCLAEGLAKNGKIVSIEIDKSISGMIQRNLDSMGISEFVDMKFGDAQEILSELNSSIDLVFIDAAKYEYENYYELIIDKVGPGGVIIADNTLWKGRVLKNKMDKMTNAMHNFNKKVAEDSRVEVLILPYRDGISLIRKK